MRFIVVFLAVFAGLSVVAEAGEQKRTMTINGVGQITAAPDMAVIRLGVTRSAPSAQKAVRENSVAMAEVIKVLRSAGVAEKDLQTSGFSIHPRYKRALSSKLSSSGVPRIISYTVSNNLAVIVRDLNTLGPMLDAVVTAGSNQISNISFSIQKPQFLQDRARKRAVAEALSKAQIFARAANVKLGQIISISQTGSGASPRPAFRQAMAPMAAKASNVPIARGQQVLTAYVTIVWKIIDR